MAHPNLPNNKTFSDSVSSPHASGLPVVVEIGKQGRLSFCNKYKKKFEGNYLFSTKFSSDIFIIT